MKHTPAQAEHIQKLQWAVSFSQGNLDGFREGDWLNAKEELYDFLYEAALFEAVKAYRKKKSTKASASRHSEQDEPDLPDSKQEFVNDVEPQELREIQREMVRLLRGLASNDDGREFMTDPIVIPKVELLVVNQGPSNPFSPMFLIDDRKALAGFNLIFYLAASGLTNQQLRTCPECKRVFVARRKPRAGETSHCSLRCARLAATRRYRTEQQRKLGHKVKVQRKPRTV